MPTTSDHPQYFEIHHGTGSYADQSVKITPESWQNRFNNVLRYQGEIYINNSLSDLLHCNPDRISLKIGRSWWFKFSTAMLESALWHCNYPSRNDRETACRDRNLKILDILTADF